MKRALFIALVLFVSLTVLVFMSLRASRTERELSENLIAAGTRQAVHALDSFIDPAREMARIGLQWMRSGRLSLDALVEGEAGQLTTAQLVRARELGTLLLPLLQVEEEVDARRR